MNSMPYETEDENEAAVLTVKEAAAPASQIEAYSTNLIIGILLIALSTALLWHATRLRSGH